MDSIYTEQVESFMTLDFIFNELELAINILSSLRVTEFFMSML